MSIVVCSIHHQTAPLALRERVAFPLEKLALYLTDLCDQEHTQEAVILSTCNRSEIYCETQDSDAVIAWFAHQHQLTREELAPFLTIYQDQAAVQHIMRVACGLDSMVLGETQILGQMKNAFSESCAASVIGPLFNRLFQQVFAVAKEVRSNTDIGACPVSVASAAMNLVKQALPDLSQARIVLLGAGATIQLVLRHLKTHPPQQITVVNRSIENAKVLAEQYGLNVAVMSALEETLQTADLVISATGSTTPLVTKAMMEKVIATRVHQPLLMVDVAVPRDIEATVGDCPAVSLYCIDDLKSMIQHNLRGREHAAEKAQEVIAQRSQDFITWLQSYSAINVTISSYRQQIEELSRVELARAYRQIEKGEDPLLVLTSFARALTNKLLHTPSVQLRRAGLEGRFDILQLVQELFALPCTGVELL